MAEAASPSGSGQVAAAADAGASGSGAGAAAGGVIVGLLVLVAAAVVVLRMRRGHRSVVISRAPSSKAVTVMNSLAGRSTGDTSDAAATPVSAQQNPLAAGSASPGAKAGSARRVLYSPQLADAGPGGSRRSKAFT